MKLYVMSGAANGTDSIDGMYYLIAETGECLASHLCSCKYFAKAIYTKEDQKELKNLQKDLVTSKCYILEKMI